jgi:phage-related protein
VSRLPTSAPSLAPWRRPTPGIDIGAERRLTGVPFMVHSWQMTIGDMRLKVVFFRTESGAEPVRRWLKSLAAPHKKAIGEDIKTVQFGWPLGMPLAEKIEPCIWEVRSKVPDGIARVLFTVDDQTMVLLHGFTKKTRKMPQAELATARARHRQYQEAGT